MAPSADPHARASIQAHSRRALSPGARAGHDYYHPVGRIIRPCAGLCQGWLGRARWKLALLTRGERETDRRTFEVNVDGARGGCRSAVSASLRLL